jgi:uncharacterized protein YggE
MNKIALNCVSILVITLCYAPAFAQVAGNRAGANANQNSPQTSGSRRYPDSYAITATEQSMSEQPNLLVNTYQFIDARLLTSVPTVNYVAVFGLNQEADKLDEANRRLQDQIARIRQGLTSLGVRPEDTYLDFITQTRTYDYKIKDNTARESLAGFQIKENMAIRYQDRTLLDRIVPLFAQNGVYDLIKVDYQTEDLAAVRVRMLEEARRIIREKEQTYGELGIKLTPVSITADSFDAFQPSDAYSSYRAFETGNVDDNYRVVERRKSSTLYFDALEPIKFDAVLNRIGFEPQVQCTYYLRVKYLVSSGGTERKVNRRCLNRPFGPPSPGGRGNDLVNEL